MRAEGIVVPIVTPLDKDGHLDRSGLHKLVNHVIDGGVDGIFVAGTTGEFARLEDRTRHELITLATEYCAGRVTIYAGVSDTGIGAVVDHLQAAHLAGADACVISLPYYFPITTEAEAERWFSTVISKSKLPTLLYDIPSNVGASIPPGTVRRLTNDVIGLKDSSSRVDLMQQYIAALGGRDRRATYLCGSEALLSSGADAGVDGFVPSMANVFPELWARIWRERTNKAALPNLVHLVERINHLNGRYDSSLGHLMWKKRILELLGVCGSTATLPTGSLTDSDDDLLRAMMVEVEIALDQRCVRRGASQ